MKKSKKEQALIPVVHVMGDLQDVKKLVRLVNKRKTLVIFRNREDGALYAEVEGDMMQFGEADMARLKTKYRLIYFDFFPGKKMAEEPEKTGSPADQQPLAAIPAKDDKPEKRKKEKKEKKEKKGKKEKNQP